MPNHPISVLGLIVPFKRRLTQCLAVNICDPRHISRGFPADGFRGAEAAELEERCWCWWCHYYY